MWFARLISAQRNRLKHVNESTFYSMVQYIAIVLFECCDSDDFSPANILMNMCFIFYYESTHANNLTNLLSIRIFIQFAVEVPGCEPYREYLYTYLREQPIWQSLRFWSAAFEDSLQCRRLHRSEPSPNQTPTRFSKFTGTTHLSPKHYHLTALNSTIRKGETDDTLLSSSDTEDTEDRHFCFGQLG